MMRLTLSLMLWFFILVFAVRAQGSDPSKSLYQIQAQLISENDRAWQSLDPVKSLAIFRELRSITAERAGEKHHLGLSEVDYILRDLELADQFSAEQKRSVLEYMQEKTRGSAYSQLGEYDEAFRHHQRGHEIATSLFKDGSYFIVDSQIRMARALLQAEREAGFAEGTEIAHSVLEVLERRQLSDSYHYREVLDILAKLYFRQNKLDKAIEAGELAYTLYESQGATETGPAALLASVVAESANRAGDHQKALRFSVVGIKNKPPASGLYGAASIRLLREFARAQIALGDTQDVARAFERILNLSDQFANDGYYPTQLRIEYREEYQEFLKTQAAPERTMQLQQEIDRLKQQSVLPKSRYSE